MTTSLDKLAKGIIEMTKIAQIAIKHNKINEVLEELDDFYVIGRKSWKKIKNEYEFMLPDYLVRTFVLHHEVSPSWIQIEIDLGHLYELDEFLRRITFKLKSTAFLAYNQTTSGTFRFALFENGKLLRSIYIKRIEAHNHLRILDNFGKKLPFETIDFGTPIYQEISRNQILDYEVLNDWYEELGFIFEERENIDFLHVEIKNFKND